ncbi:Thiamine kinase [Clostridium collagenovorans DSM 3089]|uniref:Thiamine kinase n=1 Tax=Clostridium collagenovorans DSM 3089 TaxID=1121306 RepID=A0A1M5YJ97_9CLOT|nr:phosphotransferase [Clostridium collagenovorans]SHI11994.1 Thiamine kinase [Clostridium collagenovorans DSM 3089]
MLDINISMLRIINDNNKITQRALSTELNISLGKVNYLLKELINKKYILRFEENRNDVTYKITSSGIEFLENSLNEVKETKLIIEGQLGENIEEAVILAAGKGHGVDIPIGFLEIDNTTVIERNINILLENGIKNIVIITGYKNDLYNELSEKYKEVECICNSEYMRTGTMTSLALAKGSISKDFILIESDLVFEGRSITQLLENKERNCIVITNESGSGDEAFVEIRNEQVFKMSKDIHQFSKIDGEMVGISKISQKLFYLMLKEFENHVNPYTNYEYTMLDVGRNYKIGYEKIGDLVWGEIDNLEQYEKVQKNIIPLIRRREISYKREEVKRFIVNALGKSKDDITEIAPIGGMTNKNYKVKVNDEYYVIRIPGIGTTSMINRKDECLNSQLVDAINVDAKILYLDENTGGKISQFIKGAETLNPTIAKKKENMKLVCELLRKLHDSDLEMQNSFNVFDKIEDYEFICKSCNGEFYEDYYDVKKEVLSLENVLVESGLTIRPCHNDTVAENFIKDSDGKMYLIDWEYSGLNDPMWDIAAHCIECDFSEDQEAMFLEVYFEREAMHEEKIRILIYKICQDFLWSTWTIIKEAQGDNFGTYGEDRYKRGKENLKRLQKLIG